MKSKHNNYLKTLNSYIRIHKSFYNGSTHYTTQNLLLTKSTEQVKILSKNMA